MNRSGATSANSTAAAPDSLVRDRLAGFVICTLPEARTLGAGPPDARTRAPRGTRVPLRSVRRPLTPASPGLSGRRGRSLLSRLATASSADSVRHRAELRARVLAEN